MAGFLFRLLRTSALGQQQPVVILTLELLLPAKSSRSVAATPDPLESLGQVFVHW